MGHDLATKHAGKYDALPFATHSYNTVVTYLPYSQATWHQLEEVAAGARAFAQAQRLVLRGLSGLALDSTNGLPALAGIGLALKTSLAGIIASATPGKEGDGAE